MRDGVKRVACIGECMIELQEVEAGLLRRSFGGDTLNTAVYLARLLPAEIARVDYVTALGDDGFSEEMLSAWRDEGLGTGLVARLPGRLPGLYMISTDAAGERSFHYWRSAAAARELCRSPDFEAIVERLVTYDLLYLSGISLAILPEEDRGRLVQLLGMARAAGCRVAFDGNHRPRSWAAPAEAQRWHERLLPEVDIALPTFDDEALLFGDAEPLDTVRRLQGLGVGEVAVKQGAGPCLVADATGLREVPAEPAAQVVDSTAAGDSFNAGYLAARLTDAEPAAAAAAGHRLAATVVRHRGAVIPKAEMP